MIDLVNFLLHCSACNYHIGGPQLQLGECQHCGFTFNPKQRQYALMDPDTYLTTIELSDGQKASVIERAERLVHGRIQGLYGVFAVTGRGIECLEHYFAIRKSFGTVHMGVSKQSRKLIKIWPLRLIINRLSSCRMALYF